MFEFRIFHNKFIQFRIIRFKTIIGQRLYVLIEGVDAMFLGRENVYIGEVRLLHINTVILLQKTHQFIDILPFFFD